MVLVSNNDVAKLSRQFKVFELLTTEFATIE